MKASHSLLGIDGGESMKNMAVSCAHHLACVLVIIMCKLHQL